MNPIKEAIIENFQNHVKTTVKFAPSGQLTVVVGPSRSGKTAIIRALRWLLYNDPAGVSVPDWSKPETEKEPSYCRVGATFMRVALKMESGHTVIRERTRATNRYKMLVPGEEKPNVFEGFGTGVPVEIHEITGVRPLKIGDRAININLAEQLDPPFLGRKTISAPERAKVLGKLAGTEEIDFASKQLGTDLHRRNQDEKRLVSEVAALEEKIKEYDWLPEAKKKIEALAMLVKEVKEAQVSRDKLAGLKEQLAGVDVRIAETQTILYRWRNLGNAEGHLSRATIQQYDKGLLVTLANNYWTYQKSIRACEKVIKQYAGLPEAEEKLRATQEGIDRAKRLRSLKANCLDAQEMIQKNRDVLGRLRSLGAVESLLQNLNTLEQRKERLEGLSAKWTARNAAVVGTQKLVENLAGVEKADKILVNLYTNQEIKKNFISLKNCLRQLDQDIEKARGQAVMWENRVSELEGGYHDLLESAGVCPLCGAILSEMRIKEVV